MFLLNNTFLEQQLQSYSKRNATNLLRDTKQSLSTKRLKRDFVNI